MRNDHEIRGLIDRIVRRAAPKDALEQDDLRRELWSHFEECGTSPDAIQQAIARFGPEASVAGSLRRIHRFRGAPWPAVLRDLRFGVRMIWRHPASSMLAILCLTLGIGANAAVLSWMEGVLFRPFPGVLHQDRMFAVAGVARGTSGSTAVSWPDFQDLARRSTLVETFIGDKIMGTTLSVGDRAQRVPGSIVSANYFDALGVKAALGRTFEPGEDAGRNAHPVVIISDQLWREKFGADPQVIGRTQRLNGLEHTIIGVTPPGFIGTFVGYAMQIWVPASMEETFEPGGYKLEDRDARWVEGFVRLKADVSIEQAQAELTAAAAQLEREHASTNRGRSIVLFPLAATPFNGAAAMRLSLGLMLAVTTLILLIVCANVGNLLLARSLGRHREMSVRLAIGAGRAAIVRQLLTEGLVLSAIAGAGGFVVAAWCRDLLSSLFPTRGGIGVHLSAALDWRVFLLGLAVCAIATVLCGLAPAVQAGRVDLIEALRSEAGSVVGGRGKSWVRSGLVVVQVALGLMLLIGAGLVGRSLEQMRNTSPGFATKDVLMTALDLAAAGYDAPRAKHFQDALLDRLLATPGVDSAAYARVVPFGLRPFSSSAIAVSGFVAQPDERFIVDYDEIGPGYLHTMGIPLVSGREFANADDETGRRVAVVNETMVSTYWGGTNPIGRRLQAGSQVLEIVGVAKASKYRSVAEDSRPFFYVPLRQNGAVVVTLSVRTSVAADALAATLAREERALDPTLAPYEVITMQQQVERATATQHVASTVLEFFSALALGLVAIGIYGVMSCDVSQRRREMGLRVALGAEPPAVIWSVARRSLGLTTLGLAIGLGVAMGLTRLLGTLLFRVSPRDFATFALAIAAMLVVALAASALPASRASRIDPLQTLRD